MTFKSELDFKKKFALIIFPLSLTDSLLLAIYVRSEQNFEENIVYNVSDMLTSRKTSLSHVFRKNQRLRC